MRKQIGVVAVDSGSVMFVDPCYVLPYTESDPHNGTYDQVLDKWQEVNYNGFITPWGDGMGIIVSTLYGDGVYPVYAEVTSDGRYKSITIDFDN